MKNLFGYNSAPPVSKLPLTASARAKKQQERIDRRYQKAKERQKEFEEKYSIQNMDLSAFHEEPETKAYFIGQNVYIKPSYLVSIPEYIYFNGSTGEISKNPRLLTSSFIENQKNLLDNDQKGKLSRKAITGLRNSINWLCIAAKNKWVYDKKKDRSFSFKVNFVTLTLPDTKDPISSADFQKKLLNPFLTYMRKYAGLKNYVWRLEFQANGKLHAHLTTDTFIHLKMIRDQWNRLLDSNGYLEEFYKKEGHRDPNSTDIHATKKIKNLAGYLSKYMSKKGNSFEYAGKALREKINKAVTAGLSSKEIDKLVKKLSFSRDLKKNHPLLKSVALGPSKHKGWYIQRLNFWNSPFNPRPITGRIWSCSKELSRANDCKVHIPEEECREQMKCLMRNDIEYREITTKAPERLAESVYSDHAPEPKKIGEIFFLRASDWYSKIKGVIKETFNETRWMLRKAETNHVFELT